MRYFGILSFDGDGEQIIGKICTSLDGLQADDENIYYCDSDTGVDVYDIEESWHPFTGEFLTEEDAYNINGEYYSVDTDKFPEDYMRERIIKEPDYDKLEECPRGDLVSVYKEGKLVGTRFEEY